MSMFRSLLMNIKQEPKEPYLLSDGVEYINTYFLPQNHSCEIKFALNSLEEPDVRLWLYQAAYKYYCPIRYDGELKTTYTDGNYVPWGRPGLDVTIMSTGHFDTKKHTLLYNSTNNHYVYYDGNLVNTMTNFRQLTTSPSAYMLIFAEALYYNNNPSATPKKYKLYSLKFTNNSNNQVVRSFVPAVHNGVACLYEEINGTYYYGNNGGNNFVYGED